MSILLRILTITRVRDIASNAQQCIKQTLETERRENSMNEAITYAGAIWMIIGWTIGTVIGIILIDRLDKKNVK